MATIITNVIELQNMNNDLSGDYELGCDIDASATVDWNGGAGFVPIGAGTPFFTGTFDLKGYSITDLTINRPGTDGQALFSVVQPGAWIKDGKLVNPSITGRGYIGAFIAYNFSSEIFANLKVEGGVIQGRQYVGGVIGWSTNSPIFENSSNLIEIISTWGYAGGFVGYISGNGTPQFNKSFSIGNIVTGGNYGGGFIGACDQNGDFNESYAIGNVLGTSGDYFGGFLGGATDGIARNSYARGNVTGPADYVGGFAGASNNLDKCFSAGLVIGGDPEIYIHIGGLNGMTFNTTDSYWDKQTSGQATSDGGTGKTTAEMQTRTTYPGWNFTTIWNIVEFCNNSYPCLRNVTPLCVTTPSIMGDGTIEIISLEAMRNIEMSAMGRIYVDPEGKLKYESRYARNP